MEERYVELKSDEVEFEKTTDEVEALFSFLVRNNKDNEIFNEMYENSEFQVKQIVLFNFRDYLFRTKQRGQVKLERIQYYYENEHHIQLKQLLEEKFLQLLSKKEYVSFLEFFKSNNWTWIDLINEFDKDKYKKNIFIYLTCKNINATN